MIAAPCIAMMRLRKSALALAVLFLGSAVRADSGVGSAFSGFLWTEFESAYLSSSGTLCDTRPVSLQNLDWNLAFGDWGRLWGYGCFLSMLHDGQHELHRPAFNELESGAFYGYDWKINDTFTLWNSAGGVWNPLFGYRNGNEATLWEYRYFQSLKNPYVTPFWDILGLISPVPSWARIRMGVMRAFKLTDSLVLTPSLETVWGDRDRFRARYGELPENRFLGGAFVSTTVTVKLEWFVSDVWSVWVKVRQFDTLDPQARRLENAKTDYWARPDCTIFTVGMGSRF